MFFLVDWINWVANTLSGDPLLFAFVVSLLGNILPFVPTPSLGLITLLVINPGSNFQSVGTIEIASVAALGACIGKLASYGLGYGARRVIHRPERFDSLRGYLGGSTFLVALAFAASPVIDTAFIPLGMIRYSLPKTVVALYCGKFIWILSVLFVARQSSPLIMQLIGEGSYATLVSIGLLIPVAYLLIGVDWEHRLLGRSDTLRNRIIEKIRGYFSKGRGDSGSTQVSD